MIMKEEQFADYIMNSTGKELNKDYGFEFGTECPYTPEGGMMSAGNFQGFEIWKVEMTNDERRYKRILLRNEGINKNLSNVIAFLKNN